MGPQFQIIALLKDYNMSKCPSCTLHQKVLARAIIDMELTSATFDYLACGVFRTNQKLNTTTMNLNILAGSMIFMQCRVSKLK